MSSTDISNILKQLDELAQPRQLPALFKPHDISPVLGSPEKKNPMSGYFVGGEGADPDAKPVWYAIRHRDTGHTLSSHEDEAAARDEMAGLGDRRQEYKLVKTSKRPNQFGLDEAYDAHDEGDVWYRFDPKTQNLRQRTFSHADERQARGEGWKESHAAAMREQGFFPSKYKKGQYVKKGLDGKWITINPYGTQSVEESDDGQQYAVTIDAIDHGVLSPITVTASNPAEAKQKAIASATASMAKRGYELQVRSAAVKTAQGMAEGFDSENNPWHVTDVDAVSETDFEVALQGPAGIKLNFVIRPVDFVETQHERYQIDAMDVRDLQSGKTMHWGSLQNLGKWEPIFDAIDEHFWMDQSLQAHLAKIVNYYMDAGEHGKNPDMMPDLDKRDPNGIAVPAKDFVASRNQADTAIKSAKKGMAEATGDEPFDKMMGKITGGADARQGVDSLNKSLTARTGSNPETALAKWGQEFIKWLEDICRNFAKQGADRISKLENLGNLDDGGETMAHWLIKVAKQSNTSGITLADIQEFSSEFNTHGMWAWQHFPIAWSQSEWQDYKDQWTGPDGYIASLGQGVAEGMNDWALKDKPKAKSIPQTSGMNNWARKDIHNKAYEYPPTHYDKDGKDMYGRKKPELKSQTEGASEGTDKEALRQELIKVNQQMKLNHPRYNNPNSPGHTDRYFALAKKKDAILAQLKQGVAEGLDPDTQRLEQEVRDALANGDDYTAKSLVKMAQTAADRNYLRKIIRQEMYGTGPGQGGIMEGDDRQVVFSGTGANGGKYKIIQTGPTDFMIHANGKHIDTYSSLQRAMSVLKNEVPGLTKGMAEGSSSPDVYKRRLASIQSLRYDNPQEYAKQYRALLQAMPEEHAAHANQVQKGSYSPGERGSGTGSTGRVSESSENRCMQCGMKNCKCPGNSCKCKPIAGWIPHKGFKAAVDESSMAEEASPMIAPPSNRFDSKQEAFAHAKAHGGKVFKSTYTDPNTGNKNVSFVVKKDQDVEEGWKQKLGAAALAGSMAMGASAGGVSLPGSGGSFTPDAQQTLNQRVQAMKDAEAKDAEAKEREGNLSQYGIGYLKGVVAAGPGSRALVPYEDAKKELARREAAYQKRAQGVDEVAPPGAKAERMVKHIKQGYAKDGKLTGKEKAIAYATTWKAHNQGQVEEASADQVGFHLDTERAYNAVMERFGDVVEQDQESGMMTVPRRYWLQLEQVAHDADGIGAIEAGGENIAVDEVEESYWQPQIDEAIAQEDVLDKEKRHLGDYLQSVADAVKHDAALSSKDTPVHSGDTIGSAVKTVTTDDGHDLKIHGNEDDGFRISIKGRPSRVKFKSLDEAGMACEMYRSHRRHKLESADYIEEQ